MIYTPVVPLSGIGGWRFLEATEERQRAAFGKDPLLRREIAAFKEKIGSVTSAAELVQDRTLLKVALGAFGLEDELPKRAFLRKVLEEGTETRDAFANRLADRRYRDFARAFGFGDAGGPFTGLASAMERVATAFESRSFEVAVGDVDESMRLALTWRRAIAGTVGSASETTNWYSILGDPPMRAVLQTALGLPDGIAGIDLDKQVALFADRSARILKISDPKKLAEPKMVETVIRRFLAAEEAARGPSASTPGFAALSLLQGAASASPLANLLAARA